MQAKFEPLQSSPPMQNGRFPVQLSDTATPAYQRDLHLPIHAPCASPRRSITADASPGDSPAALLHFIDQSVRMQRRIVHEGDVLYKQGDRLDRIMVINAGAVKLVTRAADGREMISAFRFKGDWIGIDAIWHGEHECDALALDTGEIWSCAYSQLLSGCREDPVLMQLFLRSISHDLAQAREQLMSLCSLPADARVAHFLYTWTQWLHTRNLRADRILLPLSREEIGSHLGMTLESVSRSLTLLVKLSLIHFAGKCRREICIPDVAALQAFCKLRQRETC